MSVNPGFDDFVKSNKAKLHKTDTSGSREGAVGYLLWGDGVHVLSGPSNGRVRVRARGQLEGWISESDLGGESLLEIYIIDVGQGDGILIKTSDFRHLMIDGGFPRRKQPTGKNAADFVDWKFVRDYGLESIALDAMVCSHNDADHYGGLADLLDSAQDAELDAAGVSVDAFFHAGVCWWAPGRNLGRVGTADGESYLVSLIDDRDSALEALDGVDERHLQGDWRDFIEKVCAVRTADGDPTPMMRLGHRPGSPIRTLPGFGPEDGDGATIHILGPIEEECDAAPALRLLSKSEPGQNTNGHSILFRLDFGRARVLLTGDLNKRSQKHLLDAFAGQRIEFQCDVAKACHHGSDDVSMAFLQAMNPAATVISSGDAEGHDHPRAAIVAASGATGYLSIRDDEIQTPLVYATEMARSVGLGKLVTLRLPDGSDIGEDALAGVRATYKEVKAGDIRATTKTKSLERGFLVTGVVYGLVNIRTDGDKILLATMDEKDSDWSVKAFRSRF